MCSRPSMSCSSGSGERERVPEEASRRQSRMSFARGARRARDWSRRRTFFEIICGRSGRNVVSRQHLVEGVKRAETDLAGIVLRWAWRARSGEIQPSVEGSGLPPTGTEKGLQERAQAEARTHLAGADVDGLLDDGVRPASERAASLVLRSRQDSGRARQAGGQGRGKRQQRIVVGQPRERPRISLARGEARQRAARTWQGTVCGADIWCEGWLGRGRLVRGAGAAREDGRRLASWSAGQCHEQDGASRRRWTPASTGRSSARGRHSVPQLGEHIAPAEEPVSCARSSEVIRGHIYRGASWVRGCRARAAGWAATARRGGS